MSTPKGDHSPSHRKRHHQNATSNISSTYVPLLPETNELMEKHRSVINMDVYHPDGTGGSGTVSQKGRGKDLREGTRQG